MGFNAKVTSGMHKSREAAMVYAEEKTVRNLELALAHENHSKATRDGLNKDLKAAKGRLAKYQKAHEDAMAN